MKSRFFLAVLAAMTTAPVVAAERAPLAWLETSLRKLDTGYGDVPSSVDCKRPVPRSAVALICASPYLRTAELLNTRAQVYARENATGTEVDHAGWRGQIPQSCKTEACIYKTFRSETDDALGGNSPYYKFHSGG